MQETFEKEEVWNLKSLISYSGSGVGSNQRRRTKANTQVQKNTANLIARQLSY